MHSFIKETKLPICSRPSDSQRRSYQMKMKNLYKIDVNQKNVILRTRVEKGRYCKKTTITAYYHKRKYFSLKINSGSDSKWTTSTSLG